MGVLHVDEFWARNPHQPPTSSRWAGLMEHSLLIGSSSSASDEANLNDNDPRSHSSSGHVMVDSVQQARDKEQGRLRHSLPSGGIKALCFSAVLHRVPFSVTGRPQHVP